MTFLSVILESVKIESVRVDRHPPYRFYVMFSPFKVRSIAILNKITGIAITAADMTDQVFKTSSN